MTVSIVNINDPTFARNLPKSNPTGSITHFLLLCLGFSAYSLRYLFTLFSNFENLLYLRKPASRAKPTRLGDVLSKCWNDFWKMAYIMRTSVVQWLK